jgi:hypothetical protein
MGLEEEFASIFFEEIAREIDKEILETLMIDILTSEGWTQTKINPAFNNNTAMYRSTWYTDTAEWIHLNAQGDYKMLRGQWLFKEPKDATMFILRWSI